MSNALSIVGSSRNNGDRQQDDFYPTPAYAVEELLKREKFNGKIWECACGDGAISKVLINNGYSVYSTDVIDRGYGDGIYDFLTTQNLFGNEKNIDVKNIITNPPYSLGLEFILKSKKIATEKIAMFLKTVFLESEARKEMFNDDVFSLKTVYQFSKRVTLYKDGIKMKNSGMISYAWYVWDKNYKGLATIQWI
jgi:hypothetical protein